MGTRAVWSARSAPAAQLDKHQFAPAIGYEDFDLAVGAGADFVREDQRVAHYQNILLGQLFSPCPIGVLYNIMSFPWLQKRRLWIAIIPTPTARDNRGSEAVNPYGRRCSRSASEGRPREYKSTPRFIQHDQSGKQHPRVID
jgi:hypothetical protein